MRSFIIFGAGVIMAPACYAAEPVAAVEPYSVIAYEREADGYLDAYWVVGADGVGEFWRISKDCPETDQEACPIPRFRMAMPASDMANFTELADRLRSTVQSKISCGEAVADRSYGKVTWLRDSTETTYYFDNGCQSETARAVGQGIDELTGFIEGHATIDAKPCATVKDAATLDLDLPRMKGFACQTHP